jgi:phage antirepressor YoqD-like protein
VTADAEKLIKQAQRLEKKAHDIRDMISGLRLMVKSDEAQAAELRKKARKLKEDFLRPALEAAAQAREDGMSFAQIAKIYGVKQHRLKGYIRREKYRVWREQRDAELKRQQMLDEHKANHTQALLDQQAKAAHIFEKRQLTRQYLYTCSKAISQAQGKKNESGRD